MSFNTRRKYNYLRSIFLVLSLVLLAQASWQSNRQASPTSITTNTTSDAPRMMSVAGSAGTNSEASASAAPFEVGRSLKNDVSPPLRTIKPAPVAPWTTVREMPERDALGGGKPAAPVTDPVAQRNFGTSSPAMPSPIQNFDGVSNRNGVYPPDTNGDVGPNHYVQWINLSFQIWNKSGVSLYGPANGNTLFTGFGAPCETTNAGDPIALYDPMADRWLLSQFTSSAPYGQCVAVSTSPDPTGSYYRYFFQFSTTVFYDYPHFGVWPDGYYMAANRFGPSFQGGSAIVFDRAGMLNGLPVTYQAFNTSYGSLLPSDLDGANLPPAGAPNYFANRGSTTLNLWKLHVDWATPANSTFTGPTSLAVAAFNQLCPGTRSCVPQPGTTVGLDGLGDRLMYRLAYRNFGDHEALVVNHSVDVGGGQAAVRWYEVRNPGGTPSLYQQGTYAPDATSRWMGSVAMDGSGNMALGYSVSSSSLYPSIRYTGRLVGDPLGTMPQGETTLFSGAGSQTGTASRYGDYSMMAVDPSDDCTFWFTTEYMPSTGTAPWRTRIGSFKFPSCGGPTPTATPTFTATPVPPSATPTNTFTPVPPTSTATAVPPTNTFTPVPPTNTPTNTFTPVPPTNTPTNTNTPTPVPPTNTPTSTNTPQPNPPDFTLSVSPASRSVSASKSVTYTVSLASLNGFSGNVSLSVTGLPSRATATWSVNPVPVPSGGGAQSVLQISTRKNTPLGTYTLTITGTGGGKTHTQNITLTVTR